MTDRKRAVAAGGGLIGAYLLLAGGDGLPSTLAEAQERAEQNAGSVIDRVQEVSESGELVVDPETGVFYDDPETGEMNDEEGDDLNLSFDAVNSAVEGSLVDPETYAPDVEGDAEAPSDGVLADAGDSMEWGSAGEQANDDLTERAAESNLSDSLKSMFDRLANYDSAERMADDLNDDGTETVEDGGSDSTEETETVEESEDTTEDTSGSTSSGSPGRNYVMPGDDGGSDYEPTTGGTSTSTNDAVDDWQDTSDSYDWGETTSGGL